MTETKNAHEGVVASIADDDLVMVVGPQGGLHPISFSNLAKLVRDTLHIGGRNLLHSSTNSIFSLTEKLESGQEYILSFKVYSPTKQGIYCPYLKIGGTTYRALGENMAIAAGITQRSIPFVASYSDKDVTSFQFLNSSAPSGFEITEVKLERGNIATDYTPAPEDIASGSWGG